MEGTIGGVPVRVLSTRIIAGHAVGTYEVTRDYSSPKVRGIIHRHHYRAGTRLNSDHDNFRKA